MVIKGQLIPEMNLGNVLHIQIFYTGELEKVVINKAIIFEPDDTVVGSQAVDLLIETANDILIPIQFAKPEL